MLRPDRKDPGDDALVFAAYNNHDASCGLPPRLRNRAESRLYYGYFENGFREQFVFTFGPATGTGTVSGGDHGWGDRKTFTLELLGEALRATQELAAQITDPRLVEASGLLPIDAALALGRLTGLTGKDEVIWLRACLAACIPQEGRQSD